MKTKWMIQKNIYTDDLDDIVKYLGELDLPYELIDVIPFETDLPPYPPYLGPVVAYGSTTLMRLAPKEWVPGIWYNEKTFRPSVWSHFLGKHYLNENAIIMPLHEVLDTWAYPKQFIRPDSDFKLFSGEVFMNGDFHDWYKKVESLIESGTYVNLTLDTPVSVAEYIFIEAEWRFFIAEKTVIAASQYREKGKLKKSHIIDFGAYDLADEIATDEWQLDSAYVVDVAKTAKGYKVIEFNNFNSSGFYKCYIKDILWGASMLAEKEFNNGG